MPPPTVRTVADLRTAVSAARGQGRRIGFVPTIGALHAGHASLLRIARQRADFVVLSIFVNPTQFGPNEDFSRYPRTWDADVAIAEAEGTDLIYAPTVEEMYPAGACTFVEVKGLDAVLCGRARPGHFRGVCTVVLTLFNQVQPDIAFFGQKDAQQARIIQQMVRDLTVPVTVQVCPIVREPDGLAMSSRNVYLSPDERRQAIVLSQALRRAGELVAGGERDAATVRQAMMDVIAASPLGRIDYVELVDDVTLQPVAKLERRTLAAVAVKFGGTRLIDNVVLEPAP